MKNTLLDLNDHLFAQMERLGDEELTDDGLIKEVERAKALCGVSMQIIANGYLVIKAHEMVDGSFCKMKLPGFFGETALGEPKITGKPQPLLVRKNA
jgi:hypothetical protein